MSIICPSCGSYLNQITNSHIKSKHTEFNSLKEFKEFFKIDTLWSPTVKETFVKKMTGKTRDPYNLTEKYYEGVKRATEKRRGKQHWNYGNHWNPTEKIKIGNGVKSSTLFQEAMKKWEDNEYRAWRLEIVNTVLIPANLKTRALNGSITAFEDKTEWEQYKSLVNKFTRKSLSLYKHIIDPSGLLKSNEYDLDHRFSKLEGFKKRISPKIIGSPVNLIPLNWIENRYQKGTKCSITESELLLEYSKFIANNESPKSLKPRKS